MKNGKFTTIDLFAGAGGLTEGFRQAGFHSVAANDFDASSANTFKLNHPKTRFIDGPVQDISSDDLLDQSGLREGELDVLLGGPPCQAFSVYNHQRGMHDERSGLFREYLRLVEGLMPRFVVMENVTGITSVASGRAVDEIYKNLGGLGYHVEHRVLKAEEYGVPQERRRIFFIGTRDGDSITWPNQTHGTSDLLVKRKLKPFVNVDQAISDLPPLLIDEGDDVAEYLSEPKCGYQKTLRQRAKQLFNHVAPHLSGVNLERLTHIPPGGSWRDIPYELLPTGMKRAKRSDHTKRYGRLHPNGLACTILTKCDLHWGAFIHPDEKQQRTLTVREAARFQSFPDRYRFMGPRGEQFRQVGNAVPPLLGKAVAKAVSRMLKKQLTEGLEKQLVN
ncbi:MAG: DNA cytosine methyltransferase [Novipirellula sp. JB048]